MTTLLALLILPLSALSQLTYAEQDFPDVATTLQDMYCRDSWIGIECSGSFLKDIKPQGLELNGSLCFQLTYLALLVTGGGAYTKENVARCWTLETGVLIGTDLPNEVPDNEYIIYSGPAYSLRIWIPHGQIEKRLVEPKMY